MPTTLNRTMKTLGQAVGKGKITVVAELENGEKESITFDANYAANYESMVTRALLTLLQSVQNKEKNDA